MDADDAASLRPAGAPETDYAVWEAPNALDATQTAHRGGPNDDEMGMSSISAVSSVDLGSKVSVAVAKKSLDVAKSQGDAAVQMIQDAAKVSEQAAKPGGFDVTA